VRYLSKENYITKPIYLSNKIHSLINVRLTERGEDYLSENNKWSKTYRGLKEVRDWFKP